MATHCAARNKRPGLDATSLEQHSNVGQMIRYTQHYDDPRCVTGDAKMVLCTVTLRCVTGDPQVEGA